MKRLLKLLAFLLTVFLIIFTLLFFWASSSTLNSNKYEKLIVNKSVSEKKKDSVFSIVTYNIGYLSGMTNNQAVIVSKKIFDINLKGVLTKIKDENPDIIAFQEIDYDASRSFNVNQETEIAKQGYKYIARGVNWDERYVPFPYWPPSIHFGKVISGQSIMSKFSLKDHKRIVLDRVANASFFRNAFYLERLAQVCKVVLNGREVVLINVHLEAFDKSTREKQFRFVVDNIFKKYRDSYPTILLGDFNSEARDENAIIKELFAMQGVGNVAFDARDIENTYDTKKPFTRIDYIFYTKKTIKCVDGRVLSEFGQISDHLPVMMKFKIK